jgi:hypothetical protein
MKARRWAYTRQSTKPSSWSFENPVSSDDDAVAEQDVVGRDVLARGANRTAEPGRIGRLATLRGSEDELASPRRISSCTGANAAGDRARSRPAVRARRGAASLLYLFRCDDAVRTLRAG